MSGTEMLALEMTDRLEAMRQERDAALARAEAADGALAAIPWHPIVAYFTHGDYGPDDWLEIEEWIRAYAPQGAQP